MNDLKYSFSQLRKADLERQNSKYACKLLKYFRLCQTTNKNYYFNITVGGSKN